MISLPRNKLSDVNDVLNFIDSNLDVIDNSTLFKLIKEITTGLINPTINFNNILLYRGRINIGDKLFTNVSELWCPEKKDVKCNRFNNRETQILYLSEFKSTVVSEVRPTPGSLVTIITCTPYPIQTINVIPIGILYGITRTELFNVKFQNDLLFTKILSYGLNKDYLMIDKVINEYLTKQVTKTIEVGDENSYKFTNIYGEHILTATVANNQIIDGILYPSIPRELNDINLAIQKNSAEKFKIVQVDVIKMDEKVKGRFTLFAGSNSIKSDGEIIYNNVFGNFVESNIHKIIA